MDNQEILKIQMDTYPSSMIIDSEKLIRSHNITTQMMIISHMVDHPESVCYYLPTNTHGARAGFNCNGIRYGKGAEYLSLPNIIVSIE